MPVENIQKGGEVVSEVNGAENMVSTDNKNSNSQDAMVVLEFASDDSAAYISLVEPLGGGREPTLLDVEAELKLAGVTHGIDLDVAKEMLAHKDYSRKACIARGTPVINGKDGRIQFFFKPAVELAPKDKRYGEKDMKNLGLVTNILAETPIAKIELPSEAVDGTDVFGRTIIARPGREAGFKIGSGTKIVSEGTLMVAEVDGNLRWLKDRFVVEDTLVIPENVGTSTGNIEFIGSVLVKGEVKENFSIISKKNITVNNFVSNATLVAEGDITVGLGVINSSLSAKGNIKLNFCENSTVDCQGDFTSQSCILSDIYCGGAMNVSTGKGVVVGGKYTAISGFNANIIGSENYAKTSVTLGRGALISDERLVLEERVKALETNLKKLIQVANLLQEYKQKTGPLPPERESMLASAIRSKFTFQREINQIKKRIKEINYELQKAADLTLYARKNLWPGTTIKIGAEVLTVRDAHIRTAVRVGKSGAIECVSI
ncbi:MAG: FapA family protein [Oscillospiraceae bacterium]|nr:FapA family protein [Oscillospiraceae bacterium]